MAGSSKEARRGRSGRAARRAERETVAAASAPVTITRRIPYYALLDDDALARIESHADWILREIGIEIHGDAEALSLFEQAGASVTDNRVCFEAGQIASLCRTAPREFVQHARNPARSVVIGGDNTVFSPAYGSPFVRDLDKGRRYGTLEDFENLVKLAYMSPWLHHSGGTICEPVDIPVNKRHLDMVYAHIRWSEKPFMGSVTAAERAEDSVAMARILYGEAFMEQNCVIMGNVNTNSPLLVDKVVTEAIPRQISMAQAVAILPIMSMTIRTSMTELQR